MAATREEREDFIRNIVVAGGNTLFPGFKDRLAEQTYHQFVDPNARVMVESTVTKSIQALRTVRFKR